MASYLHIIPHILHNIYPKPWRSPCDYPNPHGNLHVTHNTLCVCIHMETLHVHIHVETWRHTWRHGYTLCLYPHEDTHGDMESHTDMKTLHVYIHMETWRHFVQIRYGDTWRHGDTPYKICSQFKTNIYDAINLLTLIEPMT